MKLKSPLSHKDPEGVGGVGGIIFPIIYHTANVTFCPFSPDAIKQQSSIK